MPAKWQLVVADRAGVEIGEIQNVKNRNVKLPLNGAATAGFDMPLAHEYSDEFLNGETLLLAYRNGTLRYVGDAGSGEESAAGEGGRVAVVSADPSAILADRLCGKQVDARGRGVGISFGTALAQVIRGTIAKSLIDTTNGENYTGIATDAAWIADTAMGYAGPWYFKPIAEAISEISTAILDGFDFEFRPVKPVTVAAGLKLCEFRTYNARGTTRPEVIFEYGDGKRNVASYQRPRDFRVLNRAYSLPQGFPDAAMAITPPNADGTGGTFQAPITNDHDASASITKWRLREQVIPGDLVVDAFRLALANEHVRIRKNPREQVFFTLKTNIEYNFGTDYDVGDVITARAKVGSSVRFDGQFRIYGVDFAIDENGNEAVTLNLVPA